MKRIEPEQLTDELLGEAVLFLLKDNMPINTRTLIAKLRAMEENEPDDKRRQSIGRVISQVSRMIASGRRKAFREPNEADGEIRNNRDNVYSLFENSPQSETRKKH